MSFDPTPEQQAIVRAALDSSTSLMIKAYAGAAKTTTLTMIANAMPKNVPALALAFNTRIKKELEARFPANFTVMTLNGLGHRAWASAIGKRLTLDDKKLGKLITQVSKDAGFDLASEQWGDLRRLVSFAMQRGLVPSSFEHASKNALLPDSQETWAKLCDDLWIEATPAICDLARSVLIESIKMAWQGTVSFDDQIYMGALFGGQFPRFPLVLVDEAQDLSVLNHIMLAKCSSDRLIVVGDPKQAIYAFRGADSSSMEKIRALRPKWIDLPLATTFRCPKVIVERQQGHAPGFVAWATNAIGAFMQFPLTEGEPWSWATMAPYVNGGEAAILCRNNAPLLGMAFKLIRQGTSCQMLGRDIGKGLLTLSKKLMPLDDTPAHECAILISQWADHEVQLALANGKDEKLAGINDRAECLHAVLEGALAKNAGELRNALADLFSRENGRITLATGHKAKGLEWDFVLHLDPWRVPSKFAKSAAARGDSRAMEQELNLRYVLETRTKHTLALANLEDFQ